jgi:hypothetical protein
MLPRRGEGLADDRLRFRALAGHAERIEVEHERVVAHLRVMICMAVPFVLKSPACGGTLRPRW